GVCATALLGVSVSSVQAAPINYLDKVGSTAVFSGIVEDSATDATPLYGMPTISVHTLDFNPTSFGSFASGGSADVTDGLLAFTVAANPGYGVTRLVLSECGDYTLMGLGTAATSANVGTAFFVQITEVDNVTLTDSVTVP